MTLMPAAAQARLDPVFLAGFAGGQRFALWVEPPAGVRQRGAILCLQPFGDEANLSRRVLTEQARRLALQGWTTLLLDLYGTCDSAGETEDANLAAWRADLLRASHLARARAGGHFVLWGLRLGALLACDVAIALDQITSAMVFWQPSPTGKHALDTLLRLRRVGGVARGTVPATGAATGAGAATETGAATGAGAATETRAATGAGPSQRLAAPEDAVAPAPSDAARKADAPPEASNSPASAASPAPIISLGGYRFASQLIADLSELQLQPAPPGEGGRACPVLMLGLQRVAGSDTPPPRLLSTLAERWIAAGYPATLQVAQSEPFWSAMEPSTPVAAFETTEAFLRGLDDHA